ncbi:hypothetical protein BB561_001563 [Smittium simulii]|uniref:Carboxymuconolactone decarboxylase-like domain-containing protein n=1 Tax=Smittium simulii TaxID=133385 RepID=A0A2T9YU53_9FUNG|nr:hypothetical protein BB561_001563 [Smittium simulii]
MLNTRDILELKSLGKGLDTDTTFLVAINAFAAASQIEKINILVQKRMIELFCFDSISEQVLFAEKARESLLKSLSIIGTPKALNAIDAVCTGVGKKVKDAISSKPLRGDEIKDYDKMFLRGKALFDELYDKQGKFKLILIYYSFKNYPDVTNLVLTDFYGKLMAEERILNRIDTELCFIGALVPLNVPLQLKSHTLGAARFGASELAINAALKIAKLIVTKHM